MPNLQTVEKIFVVPAQGRRVPLPLPGTGELIPAEGRAVRPSLAVTRLLRSGDLIIKPASAPAASAKPSPKEG